ncbi:hypothetical protein BEN78_11595 [Xanthomonas citri pv. mangiferaeindicae]|nr:hypothetical protein BEN78_11595 [Xanthomonas citri pv. mangiferaeindicae]
MAGIADVHAHAVASALGRPGRRSAVAQHLVHVQLDNDAGARRVAVADRNVAHDAMAEDPAFGADRDAFGDVEAAVGENPDFDVVGQDALLRPGRRHREQPRQ